MGEKPDETRKFNKPGDEPAGRENPSSGDSAEKTQDAHSAETRKLDAIAGEQDLRKLIERGESAGHETVYLDKLGIRGILQGGDSGDAEPEARDLLALELALGELDGEEREKAIAEAERDPRLAAQVLAMTQHLEAHQRLSRVSPRGGSFMRLTGRMRDDGYLRNVFPGSHALWRRAWFTAFAALVMLVTAMVMLSSQEAKQAPPGTVTSASTLTLLGDALSPSSVPQAVELGKTVSLGDSDGVLQLATGQRGISTRVKLARGSRFELRSRSELLLLDGEIVSADVHEDAGYLGGFSIMTPEATISTDGASFSAKTSGDRTDIAVARGRATLASRNAVGREGYSRVVTAGTCSFVSSSGPPTDPVDFIELRVERFPGDRQVKITVSNRTTMRLKVRKAGGRPSYYLFVSQDLMPGMEEAIEREIPAFPVVGALPSKTVSNAFERHRGEAWLEPDGVIGSRYQFVVDLTPPLLGMERVDYTIAARYTGEIESEQFGQARLPVWSSHTRLDLKPTGVGTEDSNR